MPQAATTIGTHLLVKVAQPIIIAFAPLRNAEGSGYTVSVSPCVEAFSSANTLETAEFMNRIIEQEIMKDQDLYMWLHCRFKTRPDDMPSIYK